MSLYKVTNVGIGHTHSVWVGGTAKDEKGNPVKLGRHITLREARDKDELDKGIGVIDLTDDEASSPLLADKIEPYVSPSASAKTTAPKAVPTSKKSPAPPTPDAPAPVLVANDYTDVVNETNVTDMKELIDAAETSSDVQQILDAENARNDGPRSTVVKHAEARLVELNAA